MSQPFRQANLMWQSYERQLRIWETNYGRDAGWIVEKQGRPIALLTDPLWADMFWDTYRLEVTTDDPELRALLSSNEFWMGDGWAEFTWRNREFGDCAPYAFPARGIIEPDRLMMRGLYLPVGHPWPLDWLILWWRKRRREAQLAPKTSTGG
jgi:hypothetical protein